jgi:putative transposase
MLSTSRCPWREYIGASRGYPTYLQTAVTPRPGLDDRDLQSSDTARGFLVLPRRCVAERTLAWLNRNRRLAEAFERTIESATA